MTAAIQPLVIADGGWAIDTAPTSDGVALLFALTLDGRPITVRLDLPRQTGLFRDRASAQGRSGEGQATDQQTRKVQLHPGAGLEGDLHQPTVGAQRVQVLLDEVAAHHVQDHVDPAFALRHGHEVLHGGVDRYVGAKVARGFRLVGAAAGGDHARARRLGHLDRGDADAAGRTMNQKGFAGLETPALEDIAEYGERRLRQPRSLHEVQPRWDR